MPQFMLLLHDRPAGFANLSPDEMQRIVQKYVAWGRSLRAKRLLAESHKLTDDPGRVLRRKKTKVLVTDGPYAETKELLGGYFIIKAKNYDDAVGHAASCPHLDFGGTIELRQVDLKA